MPQHTRFLQIVKPAAKVFFRLVDFRGFFVYFHCNGFFKSFNAKEQAKPFLT